MKKRLLVLAAPIADAKRHMNRLGYNAGAAEIVYLNGADIVSLTSYVLDKSVETKWAAHGIVSVTMLDGMTHAFGERMVFEDALAWLGSRM